MSLDATLLGEVALEDEIDLSQMRQVLVDRPVESDTQHSGVDCSHQVSPMSDMAKGVLEKFHNAQLYHWSIVDTDPFTVQANVSVQYGLEFTKLTGMDGLYHILREVLSHNGENVFPTPPLNTQEQIQLIKDMTTYGLDIKKPYPKLNGEQEGDTISPLTQATGKNNIPLISFLIQKGALVTPSVLRALSKSIFLDIDEQVSVMQLFLDSGVNISMYDELGGIMHTNYFHYESHCKFLEFILQNGLSTKIVNKGGRSLLHLAADSNDATQCYLLIDYGADLYLRDFEDKSPLDLASGDRFKDNLERHYKEYQEKQTQSPNGTLARSPQKYALELQSPIKPEVQLLDARDTGEVDIADKGELPNAIDETTHKVKDAEGVVVLDINPEIKASDTDHCLVIIHDSVGTRPEGGFKGDPSELSLIGHYYVGLGKLKDGQYCNSKQKSGYNPVMQAPIAKGKVEKEEERYLNAKDAATLHGMGKVKIDKAIPLSTEQYQKVESFITQKKKTPGTYIAGLNDCITFAQDVLDEAGLNQYRVGDLVSPNPEAKRTIARFVAGGRGYDNLIIEATCKEEVAQKYNVPLGRIDDIPAGLGEAQKFRILPLGEYLKDQGKTLE